MGDATPTTLLRVVGLGAGGHARALCEAVSLAGLYDLVGLLDPAPQRRGERLLGVPVLGGDELLPELLAAGVRHFFVALGSVGATGPRRAAFERALASGMTAVTVIHPRAIVSPHAQLGAGTVVLAGAVVGVGATLGYNVIVNTAAVVEHDCTVADHSHIATGACLTGAVRVGAGCHIGARAVLRQGVAVGDGAIVGAGAAVVRDVPAGVTVVGVPARPLVRGGGQGQ